VRVLVTGAFGYLGLALLRELEGFDVVACGRPPRTPRALAVVPRWVHTVMGDLASQGPAGADALLTAHGPFDAVLHLAGGGGPAKCQSNPTAAVSDNVLSTANLADAARRRGVPRLLMASTIAVYGTFRVPEHPYRESDPAEPDDLYGMLKLAAERVWTAPGLAAGTALRIANIYGAGAGVDLGIEGAVERFARRAALGGEIAIFGTGAQKIDYVHIDDVVRAFRLALARPGLPPVLNVGGGQPVAIATLAETCAEIGRRRGTAVTLVRKPDPGGRVWPDRVLDNEQAGQALDWRPQVSLKEGLENMVDMMGRASDGAVPPQAPEAR
jgi:UDP-glucose 4-epimerase